MCIYQLQIEFIFKNISLNEKNKRIIGFFNTSLKHPYFRSYNYISCILFIYLLPVTYVFIAHYIYIYCLLLVYVLLIIFIFAACYLCTYCLLLMYMFPFSLRIYLPYFLDNISLRSKKNMKVLLYHRKCITFATH